MTRGRERQIVQAGYDTLADGYLEWSAQIEGDPRHRFLEKFDRRLDRGTRVLDLGCGAGLPSTRFLAERFEVVGVDCSEAQLRLARGNVPRATFVKADFSELSLPNTSFGGISALYSISHVPRDKHAELFGRIAAWLEPGGLFVASLGTADTPDWTGQWLGVRCSSVATTPKRIVASLSESACGSCATKSSR